VVALDLDRPTGDITSEAAMSEDECLAALTPGRRRWKRDLLFVGEMGGQHHAAAALCAQAFGGGAMGGARHGHR
jgi:nicotinate-nucleotide--dimethylbenzimidazole phosphoribosyltransferase